MSARPLGEPARILRAVAAYYAAKYRRHGPTPQGADWNSARSQALRFEQLLKVCPTAGRYSLIDYGCGYGALADVLSAKGIPCDYAGFDVSPYLVRRARARHRGRPGRRFSSSPPAFRPADYVVASGIFNVKLDFSVEDWEPYIFAVLDRIHRWSRRGFAFNILTSYSDRDRMRPDLYYGDPRFFFHYCKTRFSRQVSLLHDYGLYEFTVLVRKPGSAFRREAW